MVKSFYVTLPSNGSMNLFSNNTVTEFTNRLAKPIYLDGEWEVGLIECSYPHSWWQVTRNNSRFEYANIGDGLERGAVIPWSTHDCISSLQNITLDTITEKRWLDPSKRELVIVDDPPFFNDRFQLKAKDGYMLKFEGKLCRSLGLTDPTVVGSAWTRAPQPWTSENIDHLFLYTDIVAPHRVGDAEVPLLRQVPVGESRRIIGVTWPIITYFPVSKNPIETIDIVIRDGTGRKIPFTSGRTIVLLHFRPLQ